MKTNLRQSLFSLASILLLAFVACTDVGTDMPVSPEKTAENRAHLFVSSDLMEEGVFRTIVPTDVTEEEIIAVFLRAFVPGTDTQVGIDGGYFNGDGNLTALQVMRSATNVYIEPGTYDFVLRLYDAWGFCCQKGVIQNKTVSADKENRLAFKTEYYSDGDYGSVELYFTWTADQRISYVSAGLFTDESDGETAVSGCELGQCNMVGDDATGYTADYRKGIAAGTYFIRYEIHAQNSAGEDVCLNAIEDVIRVVAGRTTKKTIALKDINTLYTISYGTMSDESGNSYWKEGYTAPTDRNAAKAVLLPVAENINRSGYQFDGWYESNDGGATLTGNAVTSIASGTARDVSLYAKWTHLAEFYVAESGKDDSGDGSELHPYATVARALSEIDSLNNASHAYTVYVDGTIRENIVIRDVKASSIAITGRVSDSITGDVDGDGTGDGTVLTVKGTVPVTFSKLTIMGGSAEYGGGVFVGEGASVTIGKDICIAGNYADSAGAGAYVASGGTLAMTDGSITVNTADSSGSGAGVCVASGGTFTMTGGTISGNSGGTGTAVVNRGTFIMGGSAQISSDNDVYLPAGKTVSVVRSLTGTVPVAIITPAEYNEGTTILDLAADAITTVSAECGAFKIATQGSGSSAVEWVLSPEGKLQRKIAKPAITVVLPEYAQIPVEQKTTDSDVTFTVSGTEWSGFEWTFDDEDYGTERTMTVSTGSLARGTYDVTLTATRTTTAGTERVSYFAQVKVE